MLIARALAIAAILVPFYASASPLNMVGTGDGVDMLTSLAADFNARQVGVVVAIPPSIGSGGGIAAIGSGREPLARIARPLKDTEIERGIKAVPIAKLPSAIYVQKEVGVTGLTARQLADIFSGAIRNWKEVGGPDLAIKVVRREDADSTLLVLRQFMPGWKELVLTERSKLAMTTQEGIDSVEAVSGGIGFGPFTRALESRVTVLRIDGQYPGEPKYPSAVVLAVAFKDSPTAEAQGFLAYLRSEDARRIMSGFGAVPLSAGGE